MASTPRLKIFHPDGTYSASAKFLDDAALMVGFRGEGGVIRWGSTSGPIIWREGHETLMASDSCDAAAEIMHDRIEAL